MSIFKPKIEKNKKIGNFGIFKLIFEGEGVDIGVGIRGVSRSLKYVEIGFKTFVLPER